MKVLKCVNVNIQPKPVLLMDIDPFLYSCTIYLYITLIKFFFRAFTCSQRGTLDFCRSLMLFIFGFVFVHLWHLLSLTCFRSLLANSFPTSENGTNLWGIFPCQGLKWGSSQGCKKGENGEGLVYEEELHYPASKKLSLILKISNAFTMM